MDTTTLLIKIIGPTMLLVGIAIVRNKKLIPEVMKMFSSAGAMFYGGIVSLILGLAMVLQHNIWNGDLATTIVSIVGWAALLKGVYLILAPARALRLTKSMLKGGGQNMIWIHVVAGAYLTYVGYLT